MLPQSHFIAFNDINSKRFSNALRGSTAFTLSAAYINQPVKNWTRSTFYMRASFVDKLRESVPWSKLVARLRLNPCWFISEKHVNIQSAILMAVTMTTCPTALLAAESILLISHL